MARVAVFRQAKVMKIHTFLRQHIRDLLPSPKKSTVSPPGSDDLIRRKGDVAQNRIVFWTIW
jgi:hypothetical protein